MMAWIIIASVSRPLRELERVKRELQANLRLIYPDSPARAPIQTHLQAIDAELAERADGHHVGGVLP
jgi:hypothetical protein